jgi:hypothetical protein
MMLFDCIISQLIVKGLSKTHQDFLSINDDLFRKSTWISLVLMNSFLKSPRPSLPLKRAPPLSPSPFPLRGQGMCQPPYSVLKPLRYKVGGPSEVYASSRAAVCGMRPHGYKSLTGCLVLARSLLEACLVLAQSFFENLPGFP